MGPEMGVMIYLTTIKCATEDILISGIVELKSIQDSPKIVTGDNFGVVFQHEKNVNQQFKILTTNAIELINVAQLSI